MYLHKLNQTKHPANLNLKKVLVIYYSQSGQLLDIVKNITKDIGNNEDVNLDFYEIKLKNAFNFPWKKKDFFDAFPESFLQIPSELDDVENPLLKTKYDLIILGYQVWYLTPSIPVNSFLKSDKFKTLFENTPIITVIGCRNMWLMAQEKMKKLLVQNKANLVGNIALVDRHINHISVITIVQWMFTGVKKKYLGIFPKPGVSQKDIDESVKFGAPILKSLLSNDYSKLQDNLLEKKAVLIKPFLINVDKRANIIFSKWSNLIYKKGKANDPKRSIWLKVFNYYLIFAIWFIAPILFVVYLLTFPIMFAKIKRNKKYYSSIKLKD